ncbi:MAG: exosortase/archaeosortase family protein [Planctomycetota bacterium]
MTKLAAHAHSRLNGRVPQAPRTAKAVAPVSAGARVRRHACLVCAAALAACLLWSYWPTLVELYGFWSRNDDYSAGQLVPLVAVYLVWRQRAFLRSRPAQPSPWGLGLLGLAELLRLGAVYYGFGSIERVAGAVLLAAGWRVFWRLRWVLAFLVLMLPLPARVHEAIALPLQRLATNLAAVALELLGFFVVREGHVLRLDAQTTVGVTEACSGLRMLTAFVFVSAVLAFLIRRPPWQKALLVASSIPIAVLCNTIRSAATAVFVYYAQDPDLSETFHDLAGLAMMPLAILLSVLLLKFFALLSPPAGVAPANGR